MKIFIAIATALALVSSPAVAARKASDGYRFGEAEYTRTEFQVKVIEYDTAEEVTAAAATAGATVMPSRGKTGIRVDSVIKAWSVLNESGCTIHIVKAAKSYQPELLGHEMAHCIHGRWHP